jgi:hypothetical protein
MGGRGNDESVTRRKTQNGVNVHHSTRAVSAVARGKRLPLVLRNACIDHKKYTDLLALISHVTKNVISEKSVKNR